MKELIQKAEKHFHKKLPFVLYRQPKTSILQAFLMPNTEVETTDFNQSGFCFYPFDNTKQNYFFDIEKAVFEKNQLSEIELNIGFNKSDTLIDENEAEKRRYIQLVAESIHLLKQKEYDKIVLSRPIQIQLKNENVFEVFQNLLGLYKNAMVYIWFHPNEGIWVGATPETLVKYAQSSLSTMALAGTRLHQENIEPQWREKEMEEQKLVENYILQKLRKYSQQLKASETYNKLAGNLVHLNTDITARIQQKDLEKVVLDLHPTPAVCGIPTEKAKNFILNNETYAREFYAGFFGELNMAKEKTRTRSRRNQETLAIRQRRAETNLYVNLRCMKIKNNQAEIFVGGGITSSSNATEEWKETRDKSQTLLKVL